MLDLHIEAYSHELLTTAQQQHQHDGQYSPGPGHNDHLAQIDYVSDMTTTGQHRWLFLCSFILLVMVLIPVSCLDINMVTQLIISLATCM